MSASNEEVFARGKMFELVHLTQPDGRVFEVARRAPGVRLLIADMTLRKLLLTKEFRTELQAWDYRLPGGKVFDSLAEYETFRQSDQDILAAAKRKAVQEAAEETGLEISDPQLITKSTLGATVEWDLFVFEVTNFVAHQDGQQLEHGEQIEADNWVDFNEARQMIMDGQMREERIALLTLQWLYKQKGVTS